MQDGCLLRRDVPADINATRRNLMFCKCPMSLVHSDHMTFHPTHLALFREAANMDQDCGRGFGGGIMIYDKGVACSSVHVGEWTIRHVPMFENLKKNDAKMSCCFRGMSSRSHPGLFLEFTASSKSRRCATDVRYRITTSSTTGN
jgi:hypothetical protein